jgi:mannose-6-phosphate isomerase-like protein (cupin superfamily)
MADNVKTDAVFAKHPKWEGVSMKHFFAGADTAERLNNLEINIVPGFQIPPHTHENASEFFYVISGEGEFLDGAEWRAVKKGDAFKAPAGMSHGVKNTGTETLALFSTFSPPVR